ncbi:hypothetical protein, partial [Lactiplantibacillus pentosus]|uniref:hypothetical protein n=1 Tax=Lactiplantibacillus pentosus TaxID=1589 RepID=UPI001CDA5D3F
MQTVVINRKELKPRAKYVINLRSSRRAREVSRKFLRTCLKSGQFDMIVQKRMITYELPQQS